jgi:hypothetical protein
MERKPNYKPKHTIVESLPKEIQQIADSAFDHVGTVLDNMKATELVDTLPLLLVLTWAGKVAYDKNAEIDKKLENLNLSDLEKKMLNDARPNIVENLMLAGLGYKLALSDGIPSEVAGITMLIGVGVTRFVTGEVAPPNTIQGIANRLVKLIETGQWLP